jgi:hypothetical protein
MIMRKGPQVSRNVTKKPIGSGLLSDAKVTAGDTRPAKILTAVFRWLRIGPPVLFDLFHASGSGAGVAVILAFKLILLLTSNSPNNLQANKT